MLNCWIFDGELIDNSLEFFIACDESSKLEKLWKSKYNIRQGMLPSFISKELAQKVRKPSNEYHRSGFDSEILMIANCEFFWSSQSKELQSILECVTIIWYGVDYRNH